jgi:murein DD-endopeptidase MepM/ murein hydrolase activator NlpD
MDLFQITDRRIERLASAAPASSADGRALRRTLDLDAFEPSSYVLRVQPAMLREARFELSIDAVAPLAFPVSGYDRRAIQSGFGAEREGGRRAHRGVDIFAERGTEALAAVDAWVSRVDTTPRGGNVVWLQPVFGDLRLYYAHLDEQLVEAGQLVTAGQVLGLVGNTGNAITTPPHLHFGVYLRRRGGARDPIGFLY